jgi:hypothetical protein
MRDFLKFLAVIVLVAAGVAALPLNRTERTPGPLSEHMTLCDFCSDASGAAEGGTPPLTKCEVMRKLAETHVNERKRLINTASTKLTSLP